MLIYIISKFLQKIFYREIYLIILSDHYAVKNGFVMNILIYCSRKMCDVDEERQELTTLRSSVTK